MRFLNYFHIHKNVYYRTDKMIFDYIFIYLAGITQVLTYGKLHG